MRRTGSAFGAGTCVGGAIAVGLLHLFKEKPDESSLETKEYDSSTTRKFFKYGQPKSHHSFHSYSDHSLMYDHSRKIPLWVSETITKKDKNAASRSKSRFKPDPAIPPNYSSSNEDFRHSGWSRGHMAPAGNYKHSQQAMDDTFFLTNIVPQNADNNSGYWNRLEMYCRDLAKKFDEVHIISGPLFLPETDKELEKKFVKYEVLGSGQVAAPTHLYKVVLAEKESGQPSLAVFIVPNKPVGKVDLREFQVGLDTLESSTGCTFHPSLDRTKVSDLCNEDGCKLISPEELDLFVLRKRLIAAKSREELDRVWNKSRVKNKHTAQIYEERKEELN